MRWPVAIVLVFACSQRAGPRAADAHVRTDGAVPPDVGREDTGAADAEPSDASDDANGSLSIETYCERATEAWCRWLDRCGGGCVADRDRSWCGSARRAVAAGRLAYDPAMARRCLARLEAAALDCADDGVLAGCVPFEGRVPLGGACYPGHLFDEDECADGGVCAGAADYAGFCPGVCVAGGILGDLCDRVPCAEGLRCVGEVCLPLGELGDDCRDTPCRPELRCQPLDGALRCVAVRDVGETCGPGAHERCVTGASCLGGICVDSAPTGAPCWDHAQCGPSDACDLATGSCAPRPPLGAPCSGLCAEGACVPDASSSTGRRCLLLAGEGERCDPAPCAPELRCRDGRCERPSRDACATTSDCVEGLWCDGSRCREPSPEGGPCGLCADGLACRGGLCGPPLPNGAPCPGDEDCGPAADCVDLDGAGPRCRLRRICDGP